MMEQVKQEWLTQVESAVFCSGRERPGALTVRKLVYISYTLIDHFQDILIDSQTMDITHFAVVFLYDLTI